MYAAAILLTNSFWKLFSDTPFFANDGSFFLEIMVINLGYSRCKDLIQKDYGRKLDRKERFRLAFGIWLFVLLLSYGVHSTSALKFFKSFLLAPVFLLIVEIFVKSESVYGTEQTEGTKNNLPRSVP